MRSVNRPIPIKKWKRAHPHIVPTDYRKLRGNREPDRIVWRWFHWSPYPDKYVYYWHDGMKEMRHANLPEYQKYKTEQLI